jgi:hypothetical protein
MTSVLFALMVSVFAPEGWTSPAVIGLYTDPMACEAALAILDTSGQTPPIVSRYPVATWCDSLATAPDT